MKLTNEWECSKCKVRVKGMAPPGKCPTEECPGRNKDFMLVNPPLISDVRFVSSLKEERFVDHMDRLVPTQSLGEENVRLWQAIVGREADLEAGRISSWLEGDREGEAPLLRRATFLANLEVDKGIRLEMFTDFEIVFFLDPSGDLVDEVARLRKEAAKRRRTTP